MDVAATLLRLPLNSDNHIRQFLFHIGQLAALTPPVDCLDEVHQVPLGHDEVCGDRGGVSAPLRVPNHRHGLVVLELRQMSIAQRNRFQRRIIFDRRGDQKILSGSCRWHPFDVDRRVPLWRRLDLLQQTLLCHCVQHGFARHRLQLLVALLQLLQLLLPMVAESDAMHAEMQRFGIDVSGRGNDSTPGRNRLGLGDQTLIHRKRVALCL